MNVPIDITGVALSTGRLLLRPWREDDLEDLYTYARVDGVGQMAGWTPHRSLDESRDILKMFIEEKRTFALEYEGRAIGSLGIERYDEERLPELSALRAREIGYVLSKDYWGRGLMPEAVRAVLDWLFREAGLDCVVSGHFDWNRQSARVIEKCGFRYVRTIPYKTTFGKVEQSMAYVRYKE